VTDFGTFKLDSVIMHLVPKGKAQPDGPDPIEYSEAPIELDATDKGFIEIRLRETLGGRARPVVENTDLGSQTPTLVRGLLNESGELVADSATLARMLYLRQKWVSPLGLVMTILGSIDGEGCLVIAKMEHQEGMRVQPTQTAAGLRTYRAQYLKDLILGEGTRVFKAGLFKASGAQENAKLTGDVVDDQQGQGGVADYFVDFLGCQFVQRPDYLTESFMKTAQGFILKATKHDPEATAEYEIALLSEMQSRGNRILPEVFARDHLRAEHQDEFIARIEEVGLPRKGFTKDVSLVRGSIRRMKVQTLRGATVLVPPEMYEDGSLTVTDLADNDASRITVTDRITGISGASGPKALDA
jgi:hypothetical protein